MCKLIRRGRLYMSSRGCNPWLRIICQPRVLPGDIQIDPPRRIEPTILICEGSGVLSLKKGDSKTNTWKLDKIYIHPNQQDKGTGKILLDYITRNIQPKGANVLKINVNRHNKAIGFYQKWGFKIITEEDIDIGNNYFMNDYI